jgi:hypothetical protein
VYTPGEWVGLAGQGGVATAFWQATHQHIGKEEHTMRSLSVLGILCVVTVPVFAVPIDYTFNATSGSIVLNVAGQGSTRSAIGGTFAISIDPGSDAYINAGDSFVLEDSTLVNTQSLSIDLAGLARCRIRPSSVRLLDFAPVSPGTIGTGGVGTVVSDAYYAATVFITGFATTTFKTTTWAGTLSPYTVSFTMSQSSSETMTSTLNGTFYYIVGIPDIALTLTLDLIVSVEGTAHVVPDPALSGLVAMGVAGAGGWLRFRRRR